MRAAQGQPLLPALAGPRGRGNLDSTLLTLHACPFFSVPLCPSVFLSLTSPPLPMEVPNSAPGSNTHNSFSLLFSMASLWLHSHHHPHQPLSLSSFWVSVSDPFFVRLCLLLVFLPSVSSASIFPEQASIDHVLDARHCPAPFGVLRVSASLLLVFPPSAPIGLLPSHPPASLGSNTGVIQFYEKPPGLPQNGPTTTGTRCAVPHRGMGGRGEGEGSGLAPEAGGLVLGDGRWETLGILSLHWLKEGGVGRGEKRG